MAKVVRALQLAWPYGSTVDERRRTIQAQAREVESADLLEIGRAHV